MSKLKELFYPNQVNRPDDVLQRIPSEYKKLGKFMLLFQSKTTTVFRIIGENDYALKIVSGCDLNTDKWRSSKREVEILQRLAECKHVVRLYDNKFDTKASVIYLLEEYCEPLNKFTAMTVYDAISVCIDLCDALIECRDAGVAHLDLKPDNIFIDAHHVVRLGDFGVSLPLEELADNEIKRGTLRYMAPEVFREGNCSERSEIYTVGLLLYMLFNNGIYTWKDAYGEIPYYQRLAGMPLQSIHINHRIDSLIMGVVYKACQFAPEDRQECFETLRDALVDIKNQINETVGNVLLKLNFLGMGTTQPLLVDRGDKS